MNKVKAYTLMFFLTFPFLSKAQTRLDTEDFAKYISKNYTVSEALKQNCEWMYAIVKVNTNAQNKVISYEFVNDPSQDVKKGFRGIVGYKFPSAMKINKHPIVFYFSIENAETCIPKEGEMRFYAPNNVVNIMVTFLQKILKDDPKTIFMPNLIYKVVYATQR